MKNDIKMVVLPELGPLLRGNNQRIESGVAILILMLKNQNGFLS